MKEREEPYKLGLHHEAFIDACVDDERYRDRRDVIESAIRLLQEREAQFGAACAEMTLGADRLMGVPTEKLPPDLAELLRGQGFGSG